MDNTFKSRHATYNLIYRIVWITKYRKNILTGEARTAAIEIIKAVAVEKEWNLLLLEVHSNHIHLLVSAPPTVPPSEIVKAVKGVSARRLLMRFPELAKKDGRGTIWAPSYYIETDGGLSLGNIKKFIDECAEH